MLTNARRRTLLALAASVFASGLGAEPAVHTVTIDGFQFRPAVVAVKQGDQVEWRNSDLVPHTATATDAAFDSGVIPMSGTFRFTATRKGRFAYICTLHPSMKGELVVQ